MGMIVDCFLVKVKATDIFDENYPVIDKKIVLKMALQNINDINHQYAIEIPDDMAMALDHTGRIERFTTNFVTVRCYRIDWDETERIRQSDFKFGD